MDNAKSTIEIVLGDIAEQDTDAVINAANKALAPGGGVAGAIHRRAGPELWHECRSLGGCETGEAKITSGYNLPARYVIHTVGPVYCGLANDPKLLAMCYKNSIKLAHEKGLESISFPSISTGAFGYPVEEAAEVAVRAVKEALKQYPVKLVRFVLYDKRTYEAYKNLVD
ncbi:O-acetyl-ADP-ribose deacetylase [candidate division WOR-3 bacterium JGI_Cruoil_03_44_89]|uniref:O-acetyl-ADP-ribose deacetylase n=1 Tax=candidate division WOR-3 bacterium JGI_Cruoil_03_44_89 TaxID=1973748 RepID=A0A235BYL1_UNCW3|nr:MAG: O-acetyl-ADP-ribose deacetylase [candidate division WOR-3 bacterium JGI_Cruoil_03_44_89]